LTEVEEELARTKALLEQYRVEGTSTVPLSPTSSHIPIAQTANEVLQHLDADDSSSLNLPRKATPSSTVQEPVFMSAPDLDSTTESPVQTKSRTCANSDSNMPSPLWPVSRRKSKDTFSMSSKGTVRHLESPPIQGLFEWDERTASPGAEGDVDGMAILISESNKGGYLGNLNWSWSLRSR
jgi:hypothetical protein